MAVAVHSMKVKENTFWLLGGFDKAVIESVSIKFKVCLVRELHSLDFGNIPIDLRDLKNGFEIFFSLILTQLREGFFVFLSFFRYVKGLHANVQSDRLN